MARLVAFIQEVNGRHIGDGVYFDEPEAAQLIERGVVMDAKDYRKMLEDKKEHRKEMREVRESKDKKEMPVSYQSMAADEEQRDKKKAPEAPKKDKMIRSPKKKKAVKSEPAESAMRWRK